MPERVDVVVVGAGVGGLATAIRLAASGRRVVVAERLDVAGGKLATERRDGYTLRRRSVAADAALRPRRPLQRGRDVAGRARRPGPAGSAVPLPLARRRHPRGARRPGRDGGGVRALHRGRWRGVAPIRRAGSADLGRQPADVPGRSDGQPVAAAPADALTGRPPRHRADDDAPPSCRQVLRRSPARAVGRPLRDVLGVVAVPRASDVGVHPAHRVALRLLVPPRWSRHPPRRAAPGGHRGGRRGPPRGGRRPHHVDDATRCPASSCSTGPDSPRRSSSPTPTPSTSTDRCCRTTVRCAVCAGPVGR